MADALSFVPRAPVAQRRPRETPRPLGNKLQEIGSRSPKDLYAFDVLADMVLDRLDADQRAQKA
jgi:hypothetical protein